MRRSSEYLDRMKVGTRGDSASTTQRLKDAHDMNLRMVGVKVDTHRDSSYSLALSGTPRHRHLRTYCDLPLRVVW